MAVRRCVRRIGKVLQNHHVCGVPANRYYEQIFSPYKVLPQYGAKNVAALQIAVFVGNTFRAKNGKLRFQTAPFWPSRS